MRCRKVESQLAPYLDGLLDSADKRAVEAHVAECPPCRRALSDMRAARDVLHALSPVRAPASFAPRVKAAARAEAAGALYPALLGGHARLVLAVGALALAVLLVGWQIGKPRLYVAPMTAGLGSADSALGEVVAVARAIEAAGNQARATHTDNHRPNRRPRRASRVASLIGPARPADTAAPSGPTAAPDAADSPPEMGAAPEEPAPEPTAPAVAPRPVMTLAAMDLRLLEASSGPVSPSPTAMLAPATDVPDETEAPGPATEVVTADSGGATAEPAAVYGAYPAVEADTPVCFASLLSTQSLD